MAAVDGPLLGTSANDHQQFNLNKALFRDYLTWTGSAAAPGAQFRDMISNKRPRFSLDMGDLENFRPGITAQFIKCPGMYLPAFDEALLDAVINEDPNYMATAGGDHFPRVGVSGVVGANHVTPRGLHAPLVGQLVCVEGIVSRAAITRPKARLTVYYCPATGDMKVREHRDPAALVTDTIGPSGGAPKVDDQGNRFVPEYGYSLFKDYQKFSLQEMPESTPTGQLPRGLEVMASADLVNLVKPGDRVQVTGTYRAIPHSQNGITSGIFRFVVVACSLRQLKTGGSAAQERVLTAKDIKNIKTVANRDDTFDLLSRSFAPSISGREFEKRGLLLQALGGAEKNLPNGGHLRGDINILLIGDPSCGKSQLLRFVMNISPLAISTTGRGSSGVGLTAAVTMDKESGERVLEAGAMVLGDRGVVCIDEFDKMSTGDRVAIHEVMEQQTVTIAKAGIHTSLNARCSVLAAANPIYGNFDPSLDLHKNVHLPDSLLSRFDLVFVVRDLMSEEEDRRISGQVLRQVRFRNPQSSTRSAAADQAAAGASAVFLEPTQAGRISSSAATANGDVAVASEVFEKTFAIASQGARGRQPSELLTVDFLKKYISYCKAKPAPVLTEEAIDSIAEIYAGLREQSSRQTLAVTTRTLESLIRLSTAHAKLKLKAEIDVTDVAAARELMFASRGDYSAPQDEPASSEESEVEEPVAEENQENVEPVPVRKRKPASQPTEVPEPQPAQGAQGAVSPKKKPRKDSTAPAPAFTGELSAERLAVLMEHIVECFGEHRSTFLELDTLKQVVTTRSASAGAIFSEAEILAGLAKMEAEGKIYVASEVVYLV